MITTDAKWAFHCTALFYAEPVGYSVIAKEIEGVQSQGDTLEEARVNFMEAFKGVLETYLMSGQPIPWGRDMRPFADDVIEREERVAVEVIGKGLLR